MKIDIARVSDTRALGKSGDFNEFIARFLAAQDVKLSFKKTYERGLRQFLTWLERSGDQNPTRETVLSYKNSLEAQGHWAG